MLAIAQGAPAQTPASTAEGYCTVRVTNVGSIEGSGTTQAVVLAPTVPGSAELSGTIALFTSDNRRFDLPFANVLVTSGPKRAIVVYRFAQPVTITGAYVASLAGPSPGPCAILSPWTTELPPLPPQSSDATAITHADPAMPVQAVNDAGRADPLTCPVPNQSPRTIRAAPPPSFVHATGRVYVRVTVAADGKPIEASVSGADASIDANPNGNVVRNEAISSAMQSIYETSTFRCRHIIGTYIFVVDFRS